MLTLAVMMIAIIVPAGGLAWEREAGTIEQLLVMPFRPWQLMLAKVAPSFVVSLASLVLALWVPWWFGVPIGGSLLLFFFILPILVISGTMVPVESMPRAIHLLSFLSPLTYYMEISIGIFLKGVGMQALWPQPLAMGGLGVGIFGLGLCRFGRHLG